MNNRDILKNRLEEEERKRKKEKNRKEHGKTKKEIKKMYKQEKLAKLRAIRKEQEEADKNGVDYTEVLKGNKTGNKLNVEFKKPRKRKRWQGWDRQEAPSKVTTYQLEQK